MLKGISKTLAAAAVGTLAFSSVIAAEKVGEGFAPSLEKVEINGKVFYENGKLKGQKIELDSAKAAKINYVFKNTGPNPTKIPGRVFVHFDLGKKIALGSDFNPKTPTTKWTKDFVFTEARNVDLKKVKGKTVVMYLGIYMPKAKGVRLKLLNKEPSPGQRLKVGTIVVK